MHSPIHLHYLNSLILIPLTFLCRCLLVLIVLILTRRWFLRNKKRSRATVVVLGDIGRSPRMRYHALSLVEHGFKVDMVGYGDSIPHQRFVNNEGIKLHFLVKESLSPHFPRMLAYCMKVIMQSLIMTWTLLFKVHPAEYVLMQNPPSIPTMFICWLVSIFNGAKLVIDWHNYGYTLLGMSLGKNHLLVRIAHWYEKTLGQLSSRALCVTKAMQKDLEENWHVHATVLYDRPPEDFKPLEDIEQHELFMRLKQTYSEFEGENGSSESTVFTNLCSGKVTKPKNRPALLISGTSWTEDEDFSILLNALKMYDSTKSEGGRDLPDLICAITGKGPMKEHYLKEISKVEWHHVKIITPWLTAQDYPLLVGSADLGICLHTSSSGVDLPMKVVDMFGCGVPVAAIGFGCLNELVKHGVNGVVFHNEEGLHKELCNILEGFPENQTTLSEMRDNLVSFRQLTWTKNWNEKVSPLFET